MDYYNKRNEVICIMENLNLKDDVKFNFLYVGRIVRDKGINELIQAFIRLHLEHPDIRLYMVGPYEDTMDPIDSDTRVAIDTCDSIISVGRQTGDTLLAYYAASDCFVFPSYREGFPNTVLEAGAMGLPSIVTDINGSREIIRDGFNGIIIPPHDADALYFAMKRVFENPAEREEMANVSRDQIASRFEQGFVRGCLYSFYKAIL